MDNLELFSYHSFSIHKVSIYLSITEINSKSKDINIYI